MSDKPTLPSHDELAEVVRKGDKKVLTNVLDVLFEPCPALHDLALPQLLNSEAEQTVKTYAELVAAVRASLSALLASQESTSLAVLDQILQAHPRLGQAKVDSAQSRGEQAQLATVAQELQRLNAAYEARFPGLRYVVFVAGRGRDVIMADMERRITRGDIEQERIEGIQAMCDIALDRVGKLA